MSQKLSCQNCGHKVSTGDKFCSNCGFKITFIQKKHWIAVHTFVDDEARKTVANAPIITDRQLFEKYDTKKAELLHQWAGNDDFFYCHWFAETEEDILSALDDAGISHLIITMAHEMPRYVSKDNIKDEPLVNPFK
jgi:DNA-directed RNA polymerase subunit RPC12/RpoP